MEEVQSTARVITANRLGQIHPGAGIFIYVDPCLLTRPPGVRTALSRGRAHPLLYLAPMGGGRDPWLVFCWHLADPSFTQEEHEKVILTSEHHAGAQLVWGEPAACSLRWNNQHRAISRFHLPASSQTPWYALEGDPSTDGAWLSSLLLPRRVPCAFRVQSHHLTLWLHLAP